MISLIYEAHRYYEKTANVFEFFANKILRTD